MTIDKNGRNCTQCGIYKPWIQFHKAGTSRTGYTNKCGVCANAYNYNLAQKAKEKRLSSPKVPYIAPPKIERKPVNINRIDRIQKLFSIIRESKPELNYAQTLVLIGYFQYERVGGEQRIKDPISFDDNYLLARLENYVNKMDL